MHALRFLIPALGLVGIAAGAPKAMTLRAGSTEAKPVWQAIDSQYVGSISELQAIAKDYFEWVKDENNADGGRDACIVSSFYDPITMRVYSSTIPREGQFLNGMRSLGQAMAPVWFAAGGSANRYDGEDACYFDYEAENPQTTGQTFYTGGKMIASYGYLKYSRRNSPGPVPAPCGGSTKSPSCQTVATRLHVKWQDRQSFPEPQSDCPPYVDTTGNVFDNGQNVGQYHYDEYGQLPGDDYYYYSGDPGKRSLAGRIQRRAKQVPAECKSAMSSSMSDAKTDAAADTTSAKDSPSAEATTAATATTLVRVGKKPTDTAAEAPLATDAEAKPGPKPESSDGKKNGSKQAKPEPEPQPKPSSDKENGSKQAESKPNSEPLNGKKNGSKQAKTQPEPESSSDKKTGSKPVKSKPKPKSSKSKKKNGSKQ